MATPDHGRSGFAYGVQELLSRSKLSWIVAGVIVAITGLAIGIVFGAGYGMIAIFAATLILAVSQFAGGPVPK